MRMNAPISIALIPLYFFNLYGFEFIDIMNIAN